MQMFHGADELFKSFLAAPNVTRDMKVAKKSSLIFSFNLSFKTSVMKM